MSSAASSGARGGDIIDLDRYMRSAVKPSRDHRERLVVDAGGPTRAPRPAASSSASGSASASEPPARHVRLSHDSGLSTGSYVRRRHRTHRRTVDTTKLRDASTAVPQSSPSVREFRVACEKALREQQEQITRVAQLCERLAQPQLGARRPGTGQPGPGTGQTELRFAQKAGDSTESSDLSSSTISTDQWRKDKHRSDTCKTYKIIMSKLDELSRLFAARRPSPRPPSPLPQLSPRAAAAARPTRSSRSVSMCDKRIATEPLLTRTVSPDIQAVLAPRSGRGRQVARAQLLHCYGGSRENLSCKREEQACPTQTYDLDNPVHFYEQAKRLQALHTTTQRAYSAERPLPEGETKHDASEKWNETAERDERVCALCRGYWRALCKRLPALFTRARLF